MNGFPWSGRGHFGLEVASSSLLSFTSCWERAEIDIVFVAVVVADALRDVDVVSMITSAGLKDWEIPVK